MFHFARKRQDRYAREENPRDSTHGLSILQRGNCSELHEIRLKNKVLAITRDRQDMVFQANLLMKF